MAEIILALDLHESISSIEQRRVAHGWVTKLADDLLQSADRSSYVEFNLGTNVTNAIEVLDLMSVADLLVRPGGRLGREYPMIYEGDDPDHDDKMSIALGASFTVPREADRIFVAAAAEQFSADEEPLRYVAIGMEYIRGRNTFRQLVGLTAHPQYYVDALRIECGEGAGGKRILNEGNSRPISYGDTRAFVDCMRDLFVLQREPSL
jgi:hypothetical protein